MLNLLFPLIHLTVSDRLFFSSSFDKRMKVGASVVVARRGGCSATFDELNKYFTISGMPVVSSQYWNCAHGAAKGQAVQDGQLLCRADASGSGGKGGRGDCSEKRKKLMNPVFRPQKISKVTVLLTR